MKRKIEILAPAGSYEGMKAAMNAGCDAVYIGGSSFGARAYANNLEEETLLRAIDEAHIRDKKLYLTVNTLLKEKERTKELYRFLEKFYLQGLDAVIVQDVGVMHFIHQNFPKLPIHASTQTTLTMAQGANLLKDCGVTRLVTARELSIKEIQTIRDNTDLEIETFVHGALCYSYSGQCLMSSMIGGRSGNRGRCAQPCRMPYQFHSGDKRLSTEEQKYLLSPKDINTVSLIPELIEAGINSFKIEGRMKRPEYAAAVSYLYRKYIDLYFELGKDEYNALIKNKEYEKDMILLQDIYSRGGFSQGYGKTYNGKKMMSLYRPNHSGVHVGEVIEIKGSQVSIALKEIINAQDILEIGQKEEEGYEFTVKDPHSQGDILKTNVGRRYTPGAQEGKFQDNRAQKFHEPTIRIGDQVYRTKNNELLEQLARDYMEKDRKLGIKGLLRARRGEKLMLTLSYKDSVVTAYQDTVQDALKQPMTKEKLSAPIEKTGDTLYFLEELVIDLDDNIFVPVAWLNEIRRDAIALLQEEVAGQYRRKIEEQDNQSEVQENQNEVQDKQNKVQDRQNEVQDKQNEEQDTQNEVQNKQNEEQDKQNEVQDKLIEEQDKQNEAYVNKKTDAIEATKENLKDDLLMKNVSQEKINMGTRISQEGRTPPFGISVSVQTMEQFELALLFPEITSIYADYDTIERSKFTNMSIIAKEVGKDIYLSLPHICRLSEYERLKKDLLEIIDKEGIHGFVVKNFEEIALLHSLWLEGKPQKKIILNYNMYIYNKESKIFWNERGITDFTAPVELNYQELKHLGISDCDMIVYGYLPLMVSAQCLYESTEGCKRCKVQGNVITEAKDNTVLQNKAGYLTDRLGKKFFVQTNCNGCYNIIYNGQCLSLLKQEVEIRGLQPRNIRLDFCIETKEEMKQILTTFIEMYLYKRKTGKELTDYTTGHFKRGVE